MLFDIGISSIFLDMSPQTRETKAKKKKKTIQTKKLLHSGGNHPENKKAAY